VKVAFVTRHGKEAQVAPALARVGLTVEVINSVDTDALGTFTGSVKRKGTAIDAARRKALLGLLHCADADLGLGSEGSFGPHPATTWLAVDHEVLVLCPRDASFELVAEVTSIETNWSSTTARTLEEARAFAERIAFPSHALVVDGVSGVVDLEVVERALAERGIVQLQSDARAHVNPLRQRVIAACAQQLVMAWDSRCPTCSRRGFVARAGVPGLPCRECGAPTRLPRERVANCACGASRVDLNDTLAGPEVCDACNP
jgi:hypothetical protein